jgi:hydroxymethylbilane synthase
MIAAIGKREDARNDISNDFGALEMLPSRKCCLDFESSTTKSVTTSIPDLVIQPLRGNLQTRLRKLDKKQYQGIILAAA